MSQKYKFNNLETESFNKKIFSPNFIKDIGGVAKYKGGFFNIARMVLMAVISSSLIFLVVKAAPPLNPYSPGETLAPTCSPGDPNCTIVAPAVSGANSDITSLSGLTTALNVGQGGTGLSAIEADKLLYSSAANTLSALSLHSTLGISSGVLSVSDNSITGAKIALGSDTMGDIMYYNGTDWSRLGVGTSGQYLKTQGFGTAPQWATLDDIPGNAIDDDALDWAHFNDAMTLDATTTIDMGEGDLNFHSGTLYIDNAGKVGIGTTTPVQKLHVEGQCVTGDTLLPILESEEFSVCNPEFNSGQFSNNDQIFNNQKTTSEEMAYGHCEEEEYEENELGRFFASSDKQQNKSDQRESAENVEIDHNVHNDFILRNNILTYQATIEKNRPKAIISQLNCSAISGPIKSEAKNICPKSCEISDSACIVGEDNIYSKYNTSENFVKKIKYIAIKDVEPGMEVLSLNEKTGRLEPAKIKGLLDMGVKPIYEIKTEDGKMIRTTGNHPYLTKAKNQLFVNFSSKSNASDVKSIVFNEKFNSDIAETETMGCGGKIDQGFGKMQGIGNSNIMFNLLCNLGDQPSGQFIEFPLSLIGQDKRVFHKIDIFPDEISLSADWYSCLMACAEPGVNGHLASIASTILPAGLESYSLSGKLANNFSSIPHINPQKECKSNKNQAGLEFLSYPTTARSLADNEFGTKLEKCLTCDLVETNFAEDVLDNDLDIDFNSLIANSNDNYNKEENDLSSAQWIKVAELNIDDEIAVADVSSSKLGGVEFVKIKRITLLPPEQVYDIEVEGTHNFVANGIIAHNTYINSTATTADVKGLQIAQSGAVSGTGYGLYAAKTGAGTTNVGGYFSASGATNNYGLIVENGNVGIGTASPSYNLDVSGSTRISGRLSSEAAYDSIDDGLVLYLPFAEGSGTAVYDRSKYGNNADTFVGTPTWTASGKMGNGMSFDGNDVDGTEYVEIQDASSLDVSSAMTIEAWVYPVAFPAPGATSQYSLISDKRSTYNEAAFWFGLTNADIPSFAISINGSAYVAANGTQALTTGRWYHMVGIYDGTYVKNYVDGVLVGTSALTSGNIYNSPATIRIGGGHDESGGQPASFTYFNGTIDEFRLYNRALSADEIRERYNRGLGAQEPYVNLANGYVGIGEGGAFSRASFPLHVVGNVGGGAPPMWVTNTNDSSYAGLNFETSAGYMTGVGFGGPSMASPYGGNVFVYSDSTLSSDILLLARNSNANIRFYTGGTGASNERVRIANTGNIGFGSTAPDKALEINSATGANLRLTYNDSNGSAAYYSDFAMSSSGDLTISATGGDVSLSDENLTTTGIFQAEHLISTDDADINDNLTVGDFIIDEAAGVLAFLGNTSASILTTSASNNILTLGGANQTNNENLTLDFETTANKVLVSTGTGVTSMDFGTVDLETDAFDLSDGNITNVGNIALDSLSSDADTSINVNLGSDAGDDFTVDTDKLVIEGDTGNVGIGVTSPSAVLNLKAGTATASTAPLKFTSGTLLATPEAGALEFLTDAYYGTITTGAARKTFAFLESPVFTGTVTMPTPFTLGAISVTTTGTQINYINAATGTTGTTSSNLVFSGSPTLVTPTLGVASATSINKVSITAPANSSTITIADGKILTASDSTTLATNSITLGGGEVITFSAANALSLLTTGTTSVTFPTSGTLYGTATGSITSLQLLTSLSDETGSGAAVFATSPALVTPALGSATYTTLSGGNITDSALTAGRVTFAGTAGILSDDADLTFSTDTLSATKLLSSTSVSTPSFISTGAMTMTPTAGQNLNVALSTTGDFAVNTNQLYVDTSAGYVGVGTASPSAKLSITQTVADTGALKGIVYTGAVNTNQTLSTEIPSMTITTTGRQWATGALTTQREVLITQPTYSFVGASAITDAATVGIAGAPIQSTNATITNTHGFLIQAGAVSTATNSYGLTVNAQTGATNNYAAAFLGGNVGIGLTSPLRKLDIAGGEMLTGTSTSVLTGSIDPAASTTVTGVGTLFTTELIVGDRITVTGETRTVTAIASNTSLTVDTAFSDNANDTSPDKLWAIFSARDSSNATQVVINDLGELKLNNNFYTGAMEFGLDAGFVTAFDMAVSSSATDGTVEGYNFAVDGVNIMTVYSESDGAGIVDTTRIGIGTTTPTGNLSVTQTAAATGALKGIVYTGAVNTNQTLSTEIPSMTITTTGRQWATGALTTQREVLITQPTYSFVGASAITDAATVGIAGAPIQSTNATITNTHGFLIQAGAVSTATNSYGLTVNAQTGATNNYAAAFLGGNVGVGIAAPAYALDVLGTGTGAVIARFNDVNQTGCTLATGGTISCSSDINLKKNIENISNGLNKVLSLRPVLFNWRSDDDSPSELKNFGFIAQEVELILPKLVSTEEGGIKQLNTIGMIPVLTKAIQELDAKIGTGADGGTAINNATLTDKIAEAITKFGITIKESIVYIANLITEKITTKQLCLEDVCLNKEQLKTLLEKNAILPIEEVQEAEPIIEEPTVPSESVEQEQTTEETTIAPIIEEQQAQAAETEESVIESNPIEATETVEPAEETAEQQEPLQQE